MPVHSEPEAARHRTRRIVTTLCVGRFMIAFAAVFLAQSTPELVRSFATDPQANTPAARGAILPRPSLRCLRATGNNCAACRLKGGGARLDGAAPLVQAAVRALTTMSSLHSLVEVFVNPIFGRLSDSYGRKPFRPPHAGAGQRLVCAPPPPPPKNLGRPVRFVWLLSASQPAIPGPGSDGLCVHAHRLPRAGPPPRGSWSE
jgi:MFS family permease